MYLPAILLAGAVVLPAAEAAKPSAGRYGVPLDLAAYPQGTAKEALISALKAVAAGRHDYLLAHLVDPAFVDDRVKRLYGDRFEAQVEDTRTKLDPPTVRQLGKFAEAGEWSEEDGRAVVRLKDVADRAVFLKKVGERWYLEKRTSNRR
jgi:hypothetical protein